MKNIKNIILIGMPGAGKSTTGVILAKTLGYLFCDTDLILQEIEGKKLQNLIDESGFDAFKEAEEKAVAETLKRFKERTVVATGGSVVYSSDSMKLLKESGIVIYLKVGLSELKRRIKNIRVRGIAGRPGQSFESLMEERSKLYEKYADFTIEGEKNTIEENVEKIIDILNIKY